MQTYSSAEALKNFNTQARADSISWVAAREVGLFECGLPKTLLVNNSWWACNVVRQFRLQRVVILVRVRYHMLWPTTLLAHGGKSENAGIDSAAVMGVPFIPPRPLLLAFALN